MSAPRRIVAYCRTSTSKQDVSLEAQEENVRAMLKIKGLVPTDVIIDRDEFSGNLNRPGVRRVLDMVRSGIVETVAVYKLDRMSRSVRDTIEIVELLEKHGTCFISVMESLDTKSPMGMFFVHMMAAIAELERKTIGQRTAAALQHIKSEGCPAGPAPYGFTAQPRPAAVNGKRERRPLVINTEEQTILRKAHAFHLAGWSMAAIASAFNTEGLRTRSGAEWNRQYIFNILKTKPEGVLNAI